MGFRQFGMSRVNTAQNRQRTFAQLSSKQITKIEYKNVRAFLIYRNFRVGVFCWFTLYVLSRQLDARHLAVLVTECTAADARAKAINR